MSTQSLKSEHSNEGDEHSAAGEVDSGGMMSDECADSPLELEDEQDFSKYMPWIKVR